MADIICIIGNKGGTGKTTLSHMLCQGLGLLGQRSVCVLTDTSREPLNPEGRRYLVADARTREALAKVADKIRSLDAWMGVVDGGGNRTEMDRKLYGLADLVLLPFRDSHEDIRTLIRDLEMFPRAYAIPTQWPVIPWQRDAAERTVEELLMPYRDRILKPVNAFNATKLLLKSDIGNDIPPALAEACINVASQVLELLQIPVQPAARMPQVARPANASSRPAAPAYRAEMAMAG